MDINSKILNIYYKTVIQILGCVSWVVPVYFIVCEFLSMNERDYLYIEKSIITRLCHMLMLPILSFLVLRLFWWLCKRGLPRYEECDLDNNVSGRPL